MRKKAIEIAVKINIYLFLLVVAYYLLQIVILKGELFEIKPLLIFLFSINCFVVFMKVFKKELKINSK